MILGPMFGDLWKFGIGAPLTFFLLWVAPFAGRAVTLLAAAGIGVLHFVLDYRGFGGLCLLTGMLVSLQLTSRKARLWLAPLGAVAAAGIIFGVYGQTRNTGEGQRTTRSDVERSAMVTAAIEAIKESPLIGHGSWFSNSNVYSNFELIRHEAAREAHVGGFASPSEDPGTMALHSQILVALAEGGIFGGVFFLIFGANLIRTIYRLIFIENWRRVTPVYTLFLLSALWNLFFSPFSGAHRVYIAMACGLMLMLNEDAQSFHREDNFTDEPV